MTKTIVILVAIAITIAIAAWLYFKKPGEDTYDERDDDEDSAARESLFTARNAKKTVPFAVASVLLIGISGYFYPEMNNVLSSWSISWQTVFLLMVIAAIVMVATTKKDGPILGRQLLNKVITIPLITLGILLSMVVVHDQLLMWESEEEEVVIATPSGCTRYIDAESFRSMWQSNEVITLQLGDALCIDNSLVGGFGVVAYSGRLGKPVADGDLYTVEEWSFGSDGRNGFALLPRHQAFNELSVPTEGLQLIVSNYGLSPGAAEHLRARVFERDSAALIPSSE